MDFDRDKFKRLMHYVIARADDRDGCGATKVYKILWLAEARCHLLTGKPITGAVYIRERYGPVPKDGQAIREELAREGAIRQWRDESSWRLRSLRQPDAAGVSEEELDAIHYWIEHVDKAHKAASTGEYSHEDVWRLAEIGEPLPFFSQLATRTRKPTQQELERARRILEDLKS